MTPTTNLLRQQSTLYRRAFDDTRDVNEAYLIVHDVMARALNRGFDLDVDLEPALARALDMRTRRLATLRAAP